MKRYAIALFVTAVALLCSCSVTRQSSFAPSQTELELTMDDLNYLGDVEISVEYSKYLGIFTRVHSINGVIYDGKVRESAYARSYIAGVGLNPLLYRALPKVYETYPKAEYLIVTGQHASNKILFLGSERVVTARVKAYSIK